MGRWGERFDTATEIVGGIIGFLVALAGAAFTVAFVIVFVWEAFT